MTKLGQYMAETPKQSAPVKSPTDCLVNGCPLPGVYRLTNESSVCCVHDEEEAKDWADQTTRIRNRLKLFHLAFDMTNAPSAELMPQKARDKIVSLDGPELNGKTVGGCGAQLKGWLMLVCKGKKELPPEEKKRFDTWRSLREVT